jgi:hypothetical protein
MISGFRKEKSLAGDGKDQSADVVAEIRIQALAERPGDNIPPTTGLHELPQA